MALVHQHRARLGARRGINLLERLGERAAVMAMLTLTSNPLDRFDAARSAETVQLQELFRADCLQDGLCPSICGPFRITPDASR
jgi:hypothetical protein